VWIFDLDNTLYSAECNLFAQVDRRMGEFIARYLGVPYEYARHLQKTYYRQFGTTLSGLMQVHRMDPKPFLDYVHDIDLACMPEAPELSAAIERLPGRKLIFTNGSRRHAENVAGKLGVLHHFEDIYDIVASEFVPKPDAACYHRFLAAHGVDAASSAMFEDMRTIRGAACARHDDRAGALGFQLRSSVQRKSAPDRGRPSTCIT
jgi:putative hydrolase of the HAD superfamily